MEIYIAPATYKQRGEQTPWQGEQVSELYAGGNQMAAFQVILCPPEDVFVHLSQSNLCDWRYSTPRIRIDWSVLDNTGNPVDARLQAQFVGFVPDDEGIMTADPLLSFPGKLVPGGHYQPVFFQVFCGEHVLPRSYDIRIRLWRADGFSNESLVISRTIRLKVYGVTCPQPVDHRFHLDLWQHPSNLARMHTVDLWSEDHWRIISRYAHELASGGQKAITAIVSEAPWAGQGCASIVDYPSNLYEHSMIRVKRSINGTLECDFSIFDRYVQTFMEAGIRDEIECIGLLGVWHPDFGSPITDSNDNIRIRYYDERDGSYRFITHQADLAGYVRQFAQHLREKSWLDIARIASDEPGDVNAFRQQLQFLSEIEPEFRFKIACNHTEFMEEFQDEVTDWVPVLPAVFEDMQRLMCLHDVSRRKGGRVSFYVCCGPEVPNQFIISPLVEARLIGWLTYWLGLDGFLRWDFCVWPARPWERTSYKAPNWKAGDMFFVYPGKHGGPVSSLRWEILKMGIQEYELLRIAADYVKCHDDTEGRSINSALQEALGTILAGKDAPTTRMRGVPYAGFSYSLDWRDYENSRQLILSTLEQILITPENGATSG